MNFLKKYLWLLLTIFFAVLSIWIFIYFETSLSLRVMVILLAVIGLFGIRSGLEEIIILLVLYLGLYDLYNIRYGFAIPLSLIILAVFILTILIFLSWYRFKRVEGSLNKNLLQLYCVVIGLVVMEVFLTMYFWQVDPKTKSLVIVTIFYVIIRIFYLYINNVLNSKKIAILILISFLILGLVLIFNFLYSF